MATIYLKTIHGPARPEDLENLPEVQVRRSVRLSYLVEYIQGLRSEWESTGNDLNLVYVSVQAMLDELVNLLELAGVEDARGQTGVPEVGWLGLRRGPISYHNEQNHHETSDR